MTTTGNHPEQNTPPSQGPYVYPVQFPYSAEDEIDLFELVAGLWRRRIFIALVTGAFAMLSIVWVALLATPSYVISARLLPPTLADLAPLRVQTADANLNGVLSSQPDSALMAFSREINSRQRRVFKPSWRAMCRCCHGRRKSGTRNSPTTRFSLTISCHD